MPFFITKSSGAKEFFSLKKFGRSLRKAGASPALVKDIIGRIKKMHPLTTQEIHKFAMERLMANKSPVAGRYNLKQAIMQLGPAGYPFEQYVAKILEADGYSTLTNQLIQGRCITHEVDVIAAKKGKSYLVECKFHNSSGLKSDVKVALYIQARFEDITRSEKRKHAHSGIDKPWLWSNTQFTADALQYAECMGMRVTSWSYPAGNSLAELIDRYGLHPVTALTTISRMKKSILIQHGIMLCQDIATYKTKLSRLGFKPRDIQAMITEAQAICALKPE